MPTKRDAFDAVVIGAGIGGLTAARTLIDNGRRVTVLESRNEVGGRLRSADVAGGALDFGATWFWPGEPRVAALVKEFDLRTHQQHLAGDAMYHEPGGSKRIDGNPLDVPSNRFADGAQSLARAIANRLPTGTVSFDDPVTAIEQRDQSLHVHHTTGTTTAADVVLAVPPALAVSRIAINPPLPARINGLARVTPVWMGNMTKVVAVYDEPFWREEGLSGSAISHYGPMRELHDMSGESGQPAAIFGFASPAAGAPTPTADDIRIQLAQLFGPNSPRPIEVIITDWRHEPDTSPSGVEQLNAYQTYGHEDYQVPALDGRLHWASTETSTINPGHIEGAIVAGMRAADSILAGTGKTTTPIAHTGKGTR